MLVLIDDNDWFIDSRGLQIVFIVEDFKLSVYLVDYVLNSSLNLSHFY